MMKIQFKVPLLFSSINNTDNVNKHPYRPPLFTLLLSNFLKPHGYWAAALQGLERLIQRALMALLPIKKLRILTGLFASTLILGACAMNATNTSVDNRSNNYEHVGTNHLDYSKPFTFDTHDFGYYVYDASDVHVIYNNSSFDTWNKPVLQPSKEAGEERLWNGFYGGIRNFPPPAKVKWKTKDGTPLEAMIDIGKIFEKQEVLHRENINQITRNRIPYASIDIILEINNRTINVYMIADMNVIPVGGTEKDSGFQRNLTLAYSQTY